MKHGIMKCIIDPLCVLLWYIQFVLLLECAHWHSTFSPFAQNEAPADTQWTGWRHIVVNKTIWNPRPSTSFQRWLMSG